MALKRGSAAAQQWLWKSGKGTLARDQGPGTTQSIYEPLCDRQIRLLYWLTPGTMGLVTFDISSLPQYVAVSHRWDEHERKSALWVNHIKFETTPNVKTCLQSLKRRPGTRYIWIDLICINQQDLQERSEQVVLMGTIYRTATYVAIWLGQTDPSTQLAFRSLQSVDARQSSVMAANRLSNDILPLLEKEYFARVWIVQEILLASELILLTSAASFQWSRLAEVITVLCEKSLPLSPPKSPLHRLAGSVAVALVHGRQGDGRSLHWQTDPASNLFDILRRHGTAGCSDIRDKIFGLLSIDNIGERVGLQANYSMSAWGLIVHVLAITHTLRRSAHRMSDSALLQRLLGIDACSGEYQAWFQARIECWESQFTFHCENARVIRLPLCHIVGKTMRTVVSMRSIATTYDAMASLAHELTTEGFTSVSVQKMMVLSLGARKLGRFIVDSPASESFATDYELDLTVAERRLHRRLNRSTDDIPTDSIMPILFIDSGGNLGLARPRTKEGDILCDIYGTDSEAPVSLMLRENATGDDYSIVGRALHGDELAALLQDQTLAASWAWPVPPSYSIPRATVRKCFLYMDYPTMLALSTPMVKLV